MFRIVISARNLYIYIYTLQYARCFVLYTYNTVVNHIAFVIAGTRDLPEVYQGTAEPDDMVVGLGVREAVAATSEVKLRRVGSHVPFHVPVRSGLGHPM